jgi:DNA segregation ATPase FtsK/SpoIIIE-like protein
VTSPNITLQEQQAAIARLTELFAERARREADIRRRQTEQTAVARHKFEADAQRAQQQFAAEQAELTRAYQDAREAIFRQYEAAGFQLYQEEEQFAAKAEQEHEGAREAGKTLCQHQSQQIQTAYKADSQRQKREYAQFKQHCAARSGEIQALVTQAQKIVRRRCEWPDDPPPPNPPLPALTAQQYVERFTAAMQRAYQQVFALQHQRASRFLEDGWPVLIFLFAFLLLAYPTWLLLRGFGWGWVVAAGLAVPVVLALAARQIARPIARRQTLRLVPEFQSAIAQARAELAAALHAGHVEGKQKHQDRSSQRDRDLADARSEWKDSRHALRREHLARARQATAEFASRRESIEERFERQFQQLEERHPPQLAQLQQTFAQQAAERGERQRAREIAGEAHFAGQWSDLATFWSAGLTEFQEAVAAMNAACETRSPAWDAVDLRRELPAHEAAVIRIGRYELPLDRLSGGMPADEHLQQPPASVELPAALSYPDCPSLLLEAEGAGRDVAARTLQNVMLRLLTAFPPGKVRFTIIDPVGLGQNFSAFMHLADYDQRLVNSRIWTESAHINHLTEHMENVIQKYLRNEFASIQEYNADAGEVAEPLQILVVANFPASFSDEAARRLAAISASGAKCGVCTLISTDQKLKLPRNLDLADLERQAATLVWDESQQRFAWRESDLRPLPLVLDAPPEEERFTELVRAVGQQAKATSRVEVPFESVLPAASNWWQADSRSEIEVPLGRAGAKKLQFLRLGKGTSQHVLIAGKTGSGKSTLLNAMITNLAAHYSPDELHFYLIDFKKGVEFKAYATHQLPHARVIAIESEREFGMSVLERLDVELKRRGDLLRQAGVQDMASYRNANPRAVLPRILLVIDEFQEFFTSDDKISHDASLLLDRLVRQGRAFGMHVLLGSQTLAGAYSLARSTLGQMAVRIALQCSESDAHLILSEDNTAARLLNRPGEAIYNDANGMLEGNHPFQVVWLADHQRETWLRRAAELASQRGMRLQPATVFEGNVAADPSANEHLQGLLRSPRPERAAAQRAWLGAAVAIKDPTSANFRRQSGSNLLIVGQQEELALGMLANGLIALAASSGGLAGSLILDGAQPDSPAAGFWTAFNKQLDLGAKVVTPREAGAVVRQLAEEVDRRLSNGESVEKPIYLLVHNLARFRDLKKSDDFGMSFDEKTAASADRQLATILREGPAVGVHTLVWCDAYSNASRWLDRQSLRDFDQRVLLQMSASDSSQLMDSPGASKLGAHLAFYYSEELGRAEKFRPYAIPAAGWLDSVQLHLATRRAASAPESRPDPTVVN